MLQFKYYEDGCLFDYIRHLWENPILFKYKALL